MRSSSDHRARRRRHRRGAGRGAGTGRRSPHLERGDAAAWPAVARGVLHDSREGQGGHGALPRRFTLGDARNALRFVDGPVGDAGQEIGPDVRAAPGRSRDPPEGGDGAARCAHERGESRLRPSTGRQLAASISRADALSVRGDGGTRRWHDRGGRFRQPRNDHPSGHHVGRPGRDPVARDRDAALRALKEAVTVKTLRQIFQEERGSAVILAVGFLIFLLAMGGIAIDVAYQMTATGEAQRSMEAAALAGAGKLGFDNTAFPGARAAAVQYAALNPYHNAFGNLINLNPNTSNAPNGNVVLGVWDGAAFTPSLDGTVVNSVRCQWNSTVQTSFLRVLGLQTLPISAQAIAIANPPANPPPTGCMFPIGLSSCFFGGNTSLGCGATVSFISSSDQSAVGANTSAWVSMLPTCGTSGGGPCASNVNTASTSAATDAAANGTCQTSTLQAGTSDVESTNGMAAAVYNNHLITNFTQKYNASGTLTVMKSDGSPSYVGKGWEVYVPVIQTPGGCPPGAINGSLHVVGFTRFVITQVRNNNGDCAVANHWGGNPWDSKCYTTKNGTATSLNPGDTGSRGGYGHFHGPAARGGRRPPSAPLRSCSPCRFTPAPSST